MVVDQTIDTTNIHIFGITDTGEKRSESQSVTPLIPENDDYEVIVSRREYISDDKQPVSSYAKLTIHMAKRSTPFNILNYPLETTGDSFVYGGSGENKLRKELISLKQPKVKNEMDLKKAAIKYIQ
jgi:hypothetical protein